MSARKAGSHRDASKLAITVDATEAQSTFTSATRDWAPVTTIRPSLNPEYGGDHDVARLAVLMDPPQRARPNFVLTRLLITLATVLALVQMAAPIQRL